jgi:photosystem II stability/assembly factor-like uncharacterized protein
MRPAYGGGSVLTCVLLGMTLLLGGCSATTTKTRVVPPVSQQPVPAVTSGSTATEGPVVAARYTEAFVEAGWPHTVLVALGPGPDGAPGPELLAASPEGTDVRDIGPRMPAQQEIDSVFALNHNDVWITTASEGGGDGKLYASTDGGRMWSVHPAPSHSEAAGSTDELWFVSSLDGWLADLQPTGPGETLYRTTDGGAHWREVARLFGRPALPRGGLVEFEAADSVGWLGSGSMVTNRLEYTRDQARTWRVAAIPSHEGQTIAGPAIFGDDLVAPATRCSNGHTQLLTYASHDNGAHWSLRSAATMSTGCRQLSTAFPTPSAGWSATLVDGQVSVERTDDGARNWTTVSIPQLASRYAPTIIATDADHAWLTVYAIGGPHTNLTYCTSDAGKTWRRIDQILESQ